MGGEGIRQGKKLSKTSTWFSLLYITASFGVVILLINAQLLNVKCIFTTIVYKKSFYPKYFVLR